MARRLPEVMTMKKLSITFLAGLLLAGPAFADDQDRTQTRDPSATADQPRDRAAAGIGTQVKDVAREQETGEGATGVGTQVRELAQFHGCEQNGSAECKAHHAVHDAMAEQAGAPTDRPSLPGEPPGTRAAERHADQVRHAEVERAAMRHVGRKTAGEPTGEAQASHHGAGGAGHGMGGQGMGMGSGDCTQAAETTRSGDMHGAGTGSGGMMPGGGMH